MKMIKYIQISGFIQNEGFYESAREVLKEALVNTNKCVFISSRTDEFKENDERLSVISTWFKDLGTDFNKVSVLDERMSMQEIRQELIHAPCIYLMGGDTKRQMDFMIENEIDQILREHNGLIIGLSAGAINIARLGLVDTHVLPHFYNYDQEVLETKIMPLTYDKVIYGMADNGLIAHSTSETNFLGDIYALKEGKSTKLNTPQKRGT